MPRINEQTKNYPRGVQLDISNTEIPDGVQFVIARAADPYGAIHPMDPGEYVWPNWAEQVDGAARAGIPMGALLTVRVNGTTYPVDYINPDADRSLAGYLHALANKTYAFIVLMILTEDSVWATVKAARFYREELEKRTGKRVFLMISKADWEGVKEWETELGAENSDWPLLIIGDYETGIGSPIETPGYWKTANGLIWEETPKVYRFWPPVGEWYLSSGEEPAPEPNPIPTPTPTPEPTPGSGQAELVAELRRLNENLERIFK